VVDKSKGVVISKAEYEQLKVAALQSKQVGRYQLDREGMRTWRLDTVTGNSCLLLTADRDWTGDGANSKDKSVLHGVVPEWPFTVRLSFISFCRVRNIESRMSQ
jgi:hypothetical protein